MYYHARRIRHSGKLQNTHFEIVSTLRFLWSTYHQSHVCSFHDICFQPCRRAGRICSKSRCATLLPSEHDRGSHLFFPTVVNNVSSGSQQQIQGTTQTSASFPRLRLVVALNSATDEWHRGRCDTSLMSVGVNSDLYARTSLPLTWCQRSVVRNAQTDLWLHSILHHLHCSSPLIFDVPSGTCAASLACPATATDPSAPRHNSNQSDGSPQRTQKALNVRD